MAAHAPALRSARRSVGVGIAISRRTAAALVAVTMFVCATAVWTVVPAAVVLALPRLAALGTIAFPLLFVAVVAAMVATTKVVAELNRVYCRLTAAPERKPYRPGWRKSFCEPADSRRPTELIENIMAVSAVASVVALGVWFLFFADCAGGACSI